MPAASKIVVTLTLRLLALYALHTGHVTYFEVALPAMGHFLDKISTTTVSDAMRPTFPKAETTKLVTSYILLNLGIYRRTVKLEA